MTDVISRKALLDKIEHESAMVSHLPFQQREGALFFADTLRIWALTERTVLTSSEGAEGRYKKNLDELKEWAATVINAYHHVLSYDMTQLGVSLVNSLPSIPEGEERREGTQFIELTLLKMWADAGITEIYKYKNRIKAYRVPLTNLDLLYDTSGRMFTDVEDHASTRDGYIEDVKVSIDELIRKREALSHSGEHVRYPVRWFAEQMETRLKANDHKGGWENEPVDYLLARIEQEAAEVFRATESPGSLEKVIEEAADVANFAMMIADNARRFMTKDGDPDA